ncbi:MAG TPA: GHMP kinase [Chloroflexota bacterium]|nr:GHMP kinase [Chloroflexota bacterium]
MRHAVVLVPCTCGELVQGMVGGEPFLVSCPIDRYSRVRVTLGMAPPSNRLTSAKAVRAAAATLESIGLGGEPFTLEASCPLPPSRGFGTSTADVAGAIVATAAAAGVALSPTEVARLAVAVEPSDSSMFPGLGLLAHRTGRLSESLGPAPSLLMVVLEFHGDVDTLEYNARLNLDRLRSMEPDHLRALDLLREGLRMREPELVGEAATLSARANQPFLPKPELETVIALGRDCGALGICAAHSGTVLGVLFEPGAGRKARKLLGMAGSRIEGLSNSWMTRMVGGGVGILAVSDQNERFPTPVAAIVPSM